MRGFLGVDLGSTTTKAALVDQTGAVVGRGITNTRANFETACAVARAETLADARISRLPDPLRARVRSEYKKALRRERLGRLRLRCESAPAATDERLGRALKRLFLALVAGTDSAPEETSFRDAVLAEASFFAEPASLAEAIPYESLLGAFERALVVDEADPTVTPPEEMIDEILDGGDTDDRRTLKRCLAEPVEVLGQAGTGYGRHRLPFSSHEIRSEILCHGLGARHAFPGTRTVLDIGGQDTKAIQLDDQGLVTSFQMNDRCAAGCGRYLGYVAEELGLPLPDLAPLALKAPNPSKINSTCTVFAGAEIRDRMALGEKREDVVAGLHRAIVLRALGLLARSGGVRDELTFTGGVARNEAIVRFLREEVARHHGHQGPHGPHGSITLNVSPHSIYFGAVGAALFARMEAPSC